MPGVYVETSAGIAKIAAIGLRVANHATYHGLSLNVDMDLAPFSRINPCGYEGLATTQMSELGVQDKMDVISEKLLKHLKANLYG
jgi:lipoyl(octanoyl) transferase